MIHYKEFEVYYPANTIRSGDVLCLLGYTKYYTWRSNWLYKNRFIGQSKIEDVIEYMKYSSGCLMFVNFEKAFESLEWKFMFAYWKKLNFVKWVKTLYKDAKTTIKNNGWTTETFNLSWGVHFRSCRNKYYKWTLITSKIPNIRHLYHILKMRYQI